MDRRSVTLEGGYVDVDVIAEQSDGAPARVDLWH